MANATLTAVRAPGTDVDYDQASTAGTVKWTGAQGVYLTESRERVTIGQESNVLIERSVVAPAEIPVAFVEGDTITVTRGTTSSTEEVVRVQRTEFPGAPGLVRLLLQDG